MRAHNLRDKNTIGKRGGREEREKIHHDLSGYSSGG